MAPQGQTSTASTGQWTPAPPPGTAEQTRTDLQPVPAREVSPEEANARAIKVLRVRWPGLLAWYGKRTGHLWAMVPGRDRLLEAKTWVDLSSKIADAHRNRRP